MMSKKENEYIVPDGANLPVKPESVVEAIEMIKERLKNLQEIQDSPWLTGGDYYPDEDIQSVNTMHKIHVIRDNKTLYKIGAILYGKQKEYIEFMEVEMGLENYPVFEHCGYPYSSWIKDIKKRIAINAQKEQKEKLLEAEEAFSEFLSKEDKLTQLFNKFFN